MVQDTIFSPSFGNRPSALVGREAILRDFAAAIQSQPGSRERAIVLLGQRGSGETVLLWELADRAAQRGFVVASPTITSEDMLERIIEKIQDQARHYVSEKESRLTGGSIGALGFSGGFEFSREVQETKSPQYRLTQLARRLTAEGHGMLILVDELQANSPEVRRLVSVYQELVGERLNVAIALAGLPAAVSATLNDHVLTFLNRAYRVTLPPLAQADVASYLRQSFESLGVRVPESGCERAAETTQGSPYLLQLVGHGIVMEAGESGIVTDTGLDRALAMAVQAFKRDVCETTLAALSEKDVEFLAAMAGDSPRSRVSDIAGRMRVSVDYAQKYRKCLIDAGIIEPAGRGFVRFAVPYVQEYLSRE